MSESKLNEILAAVRKKFGTESVTLLTGDVNFNVQSLPTGCLALDVALGIGGIPKGRIIEIFGKESSGKSTLSLHIIASAQKQKLLCAYIDAEQAFDPIYAQNIGVDITKLLFYRPDSGEQAFGIIERLINNGIDLVIVDSVAALVPAHLMPIALRRLAIPLKTTKSTVIFINQLRDIIGGSWGDSEQTPGGRDLKFLASVRIELKRISYINGKDGGINGMRVRAKVVKSKVSSPLGEAEFDVIYRIGIDEVQSVVDLAIKKGLIESKPPWYEYKRESKEFRVSGKQRLYQKFKDDRDLFDGLYTDLLEGCA